MALLKIHTFFLPTRYIQKSCITCISVLDEEDERSRDLLLACNVWLKRWGQPKFPFAGFRSTALRITSSTASLVVFGKLWEKELKLTIYYSPTDGVNPRFLYHIQGVLCLRCFLRLWKNNCVRRKPCKQRSDLILNGKMRVPK